MITKPKCPKVKIYRKINIYRKANKYVCKLVFLDERRGKMEEKWCAKWCAYRRTYIYKLVRECWIVFLSIFWTLGSLQMMSFQIQVHSDFWVQCSVCTLAFLVLYRKTLKPYLYSKQTLDIIVSSLPFPVSSEASHQIVMILTGSLSLGLPTVGSLHLDISLVGIQRSYPQASK